MKLDFMHFKQSKLNLEVKKRIDDARKKRKKRKSPFLRRT